MSSLQDVLAKYDRGGVSALSFKEKTQALREMRRTKARRSDVCVALGLTVLNSVGSMEQNNIYEQVFLAALELGNQEVAKECLAALQAKFPDSTRVKRLAGLRCEAEGEYEDALKEYKALVEENPSNMAAMKRKVCVYKAQGDLRQACSALHDLLYIFSSDAFSWLELSEIHLSLGEYEAAAHCLEELVMLEPYCAHYHARLADIYYTIGGDKEHFLLARKHYTLSLNQQCANINMRALYGLVCACKAVAAASSSPSGTAAEGGGEDANASSDPVNEKLLAFAKEKLDELPHKAIM